MSAVFCPSSPPFQQDFTLQSNVSASTSTCGHFWTRYPPIISHLRRREPRSAEIITAQQICGQRLLKPASETEPTGVLRETRWASAAASSSCSYCVSVSIPLLTSPHTHHHHQGCSPLRRDEDVVSGGSVCLRFSG